MKEATPTLAEKTWTVEELLALEPSAMQKAVDGLDYDRAWNLKMTVAKKLVEIDTRMIHQECNPFVIAAQFAIAGTDAHSITKDNLRTDKEECDRLCTLRDALDTVCRRELLAKMKKI